MGLSDAVKRVILGRALRTDRMSETLLPKRIALPVYASDALSSNAYATQEILLVLSLGGVSLFAYGPWIAAAVILVYFTVIASYRQNVRAYPNGGGDYDVVSENLGPRWGVFVGSALLIDYVLTVAVSVSAAVQNLGSTIDFVGDHAVWFAVGIVLLITLINLRGVKESGGFFAIPTYIFVLSIFIMIGVAVFKAARGEPMIAESADWQITEEGLMTGFALVFLLARSFSSGTTALTGIEAVANGVPSFREPKSKNAATTLLLLGLISMSMFAGITWLALKTGVKVTTENSQLVGLPEGQNQKTVIVQVAGAVFNNAGWAVLFISLATALILALAANTAFNGFPVMGSILARDGYLPRQLYTRGDRLAFSNGILVLSGLAVLLIIVFQADVTKLIQLYIIGVFISFTLSQLGMLKHWTKLLRSRGHSDLRGKYTRSRLVNLIGFIMTGSVLVIIVFSKFTSGAWIVLIAIPVTFLVMLSIHRHYEMVRRELSTLETDKVTLPARVHALVLVSKIHKPTLRALAYARASRPNVLEALTVNVDDRESQLLEEEWTRRSIPVTLKILDSPYREITKPIIDYVKAIRSDSPNDLIAVFVPQYVVGHWWEQLLHNQSALRLKSRLLFSNSVMVISVPWQLESSESSLDNVFEDEAQRDG